MAGFAKSSRLWYSNSAMKKRFLSVLAALTLAVFLLGGCGSEKNDPEPEPEPTPEAFEPVDPHAGQVEVTDGAGGTLWVDDAQALDEFQADRTLFSVADGVVAYAGEGYTLLRGIDVSEFQNEIDWVAVRESGIDFAILRCGWRGYSGGSLNEDTYFRKNLEGAKAAGLMVGAYFFSQATSVVEGAEEAVYTLDVLSGCTLDLPVYFDWEFIGNSDARTNDTDAQTITDAALEFCSLLESEGYEAGVYSYIPAVYDMYELDRLAGVTLWMGDPGSWPEFWYEHDIWQYSFTGDVPGIDDNVDMDVMFVPVKDESEAAG